MVPWDFDFDGASDAPEAVDVASFLPLERSESDGGFEVLVPVGVFTELVVIVEGELLNCLKYCLRHLLIHSKYWMVIVLHYYWSEHWSADPPR